MTRDFSQKSHYPIYDKVKSDIDYNNKVIMFTCSPNPKHRTSNQINNYMNDVYNVFDKMRRCMKIFLVSPELNEMGNIHYHGYYQVADKIKYYKYFMPVVKKLGFCKFSKLKHPDKDWDYYCQKDYPLMEEMMKPFPVPYSHLTYKQFNNMLTMSMINGCKIKNKKLEHEVEHRRNHSILEYIKV